MHSSIHRSFVAAAGAALMSLSSIAMAAGAFHPENSEAGAVFFPEHASVKSREQVSTELAGAMRHPAWQTAISRGAPWPAAQSGTGLTREQVEADLRAAMKHPAWNGVSRGAPWPVQRPASSTSAVK